MKNGERESIAKIWIVYRFQSQVLFFPFSIFNFPFSILGAFVSSWPNFREKCGLDGFYVLEGIAAGGAVVDHPATGWAEWTV